MWLHTESKPYNISHPGIFLDYVNCCEGHTEGGVVQGSFNFVLV